MFGSCQYPVVQWEQQFGKSNPIKSCTFSQTKVTLLIDKKAPKKVRETTHTMIAMSHTEKKNHDRKT